MPFLPEGASARCVGEVAALGVAPATSAIWTSSGAPCSHQRTWAEKMGEALRPLLLRQQIHWSPEPTQANRRLEWGTRTVVRTSAVRPVLKVEGDGELELPGQDA